MSQSTGDTQLVSNAGQARSFSSRLSPESLSNTAGLQASDIAPSAGVLDSLGTVIEDSPLHVNNLFPRSTRLPCTYLFSPGCDWLANTPSRRLGLDLSVKRVNSYNQILHRGWQTFMARNLNDTHKFLLAVARTVQPLGKTSSHASEEISIVKARRLLTRMAGVNQHVQPSPNTDIISPREISELGFDQLLLGSMVNGFAGLGHDNIESIAQYLGRSENTNLSFLKFPENCSSNTVKAFTESLFRAAIVASENRVLSAVLATGYINVNDMAILTYSGNATPLERMIELHNPEGAKIVLRHGANPNRRTWINEVHTTLVGLVMYIASRMALTGQQLQSHPDWPSLVDKLVMAGAEIDLYDISPHFFHVYDCLGLHETTLRHCLSSKHQDLVKNGYFGIISHVLGEIQATQVIRSMVLECQNTHDSACLRQYQAGLDYGLEVAARKGYDELVRLLFPYTSTKAAILCAAISSGSDLLTSYILSQGPDINAVVKKYGTFWRDNMRRVERFTFDHHRQLDQFTSPLGEAIRAGNMPLVQILEEAGVLYSLNQPSQAGVTIKLAAEVGNSDYVKRILDCYPYPPPDMLSEALFSAIRLNHEDLFFTLLRAGAPDRSDTALLRMTLRNRNPRIVNALLNADVSGNGDLRVVRMALKWGDKSIITNLLSTFVFPMRFQTNIIALSPPFLSDNPSQLDYTNYDSRSLNALAKAIGESLDDDDMFRFVLESKLATQEALTECLIVALYKNNNHMFARLLSLGADGSNEAVWAMAAKHRPDMLPTLMEQRTNNRVVRTKGMKTSVLYEAIWSGASALNAVQLLINSGAVDITDVSRHIDSRCGYYMTPLGAAIKAAHSNTRIGLDVIKALLHANCDPNSIVTWGLKRNQTALLLAIELQMVDLVQLLIDHGARINESATLRVKRTPLQQAAEAGNLEIVRLLLERGADINAEPAFSRGGTALQLASISGNCTLVADLIEKGACLYTPPKACGRWPLGGAAEHGRLDMVHLLWKAKDNILCLDTVETGFEEKYCQMAMEFAVQNNHYACMELISKLSGFLYRDKKPQGPGFTDDDLVGSYMSRY